MTKLNEVGTGFTITTNKWLYNYQYVGIIANQISNCKIIYCFRNPLDNILSICRANFDKGNNYSCSIVDTAEVYLDHLKIMKIYKEKFPSIIYDLDYDIVVKQPHKAIKSLIKWLGWNGMMPTYLPILISELFLQRVMFRCVIP